LLCRGHDATVRLLLEKGRTVDATDEDGKTALHLAAEKGHEATVRLLLEKGAAVDATDKYGWTPLPDGLFALPPPTTL
jgi:ankyrin repeat protein